MVWPFTSRRERLRREASDWLVRLNGAHDESDRAAFERWYRADAEHAQAFDRMAAMFEVAADARRPQAVPAGKTVRESRARPRPLGYALAAAAVCVAVAAFVLLSARTISPLAVPGQQLAAFAAESQSRRITLSDGSEMLLSPGSAVDVALGSAERRLRLVRGEARFSVAHERRPFIVVANATEVVARGTRFVVRLAENATTVSLIEGQVDVVHPPVPGTTSRRQVTHLRPGEHVVLEAGRIRLASANAPQLAPVRRRGAPVATMLEFDDTPLDEAVKQVNRHGPPRIRLDPSLASLRVTGAFRAGDARGFADSVAAAFAVEVERASDGNLSLVPRRGVPTSR
jgi:transmembrane sensor